MNAKKLIKELEKQLRKDQDNPVVRLKLAAAYREVGRIRDAVELYRSVACTYRDARRLVQAIAVCKSALEIGPGDPDTTALLSELERAHLAEVKGVLPADGVVARGVWTPLGADAGYPAAHGRGGGVPTPIEDGAEGLSKSLLSPTPLPAPLAPHEADEDDSVALEEGMARYKLPIKRELSGPMPAVSLPAELEPLTDEDASTTPGAPTYAARSARDPEETTSGRVQPLTDYDQSAPTHLPQGDLRLAHGSAEDSAEGERVDATGRPELQPLELAIYDDSAPTRLAGPGRDGPVEAPARPGRGDQGPGHTEAPAGAPEQDHASGRSLSAAEEVDLELMAVGDLLARIGDMGDPLYSDEPTAPNAPSVSRLAFRPDMEAGTPAGEAARSAGEEGVPTNSMDEVTTGVASLPPRQDGLPHVIHDDMELGMAFHVPLGDAAGTDKLRAPFSIFSSLPPDALSELAENVVLRRYGRDEVIVREGERACACYVIVSGVARVLRREPLVPQSEATEVARLSDGALFGEHALLAEHCRQASVYAVDECHVYEIPRRLLRELAASYEQVASLLESFYRERLLSSTLTAAPYVRTLASARLATLRQRFELMRVDSGETLLEEGTRGGGLYVVTLGVVEVIKRPGPRRGALLATLGEGSYFADMAIVDGEPAKATVRAFGPAELLMLPPEDFYNLVAEQPGIWDRIRDHGRRRELERNQLLTGEATMV